MSTENSLTHTKWECKYHIVFAPKYRRQVIYKQIRADLGMILGTLCKRKGIEIIEAESVPRSYTYARKDTTEIFGIRSNGVSQREKLVNDIRKACESQIQVWECALFIKQK